MKLYVINWVEDDQKAEEYCKEIGINPKYCCIAEKYLDEPDKTK